VTNLMSFIRHRGHTRVRAGLFRRPVIGNSRTPIRSTTLHVQCEGREDADDDSSMATRYRVPISQGYEFYNALKSQGVPTRMIVSAAPTTRSQTNRRCNRVRAGEREWFEKYHGRQ
jgi:hypothetical protein